MDTTTLALHLNAALLHSLVSPPLTSVGSIRTLTRTVTTSWRTVLGPSRRQMKMASRRPSTIVDAKVRPPIDPSTSADHFVSHPLFLIEQVPTQPLTPISQPPGINGTLYHLCFRDASLKPNPRRTSRPCNDSSSSTSRQTSTCSYQCAVFFISLFKLCLMRVLSQFIGS
jgi:hypothetical protein